MQKLAFENKKISMTKLHLKKVEIKIILDINLEVKITYQTHKHIQDRPNNTENITWRI